MLKVSQLLEKQKASAEVEAFLSVTI